MKEEIKLSESVSHAMLNPFRTPRVNEGVPQGCSNF